MTTSTETITLADVRQGDRVRFIPVGSAHEIDLIVNAIRPDGLFGYRYGNGRGHGAGTYPAPETVELVHRPKSINYGEG